MSGVGTRLDRLESLIEATTPSKAVSDEAFADFADSLWGLFFRGERTTPTPLSNSTPSLSGLTDEGRLARIYAVAAECRRRGLPLPPQLSHVIETE